MYNQIFLWIRIAGLAMIVGLSACSVEAEKINYGTDQCAYCSMNIVDKAHSAQFVTQKGKQFKFDAVECLVNEIRTVTEEDLAIILVADFGSPGTMTEAQDASYLISEEIQSPMGANLSAFHDKQEAAATQAQYSGQIFSWSELKEQLRP